MSDITQPAKSLASGARFGENSPVVLLTILVVLCLAISLGAPQFYSVENIIAILRQCSLVLIVAYSLYTWLLGTATQVKQLLGRSELVTVPVVLATVAMLLVFMKTSGYPAAFFGLTFRRAGRDIAEALLFTLPLMAAVVALKAWMVAELPAMAGQPLFQLAAPVAGAPEASRSSTASDGSSQTSLGRPA